MGMDTAAMIGAGYFCFFKQYKQQNLILMSDDSH